MLRRPVPIVTLGRSGRPAAGPLLTALCALLLHGCGVSEEAQKRTPPPVPDRGATAAVNLRTLNSAEDDFAPWLWKGGTLLSFTTNRPIGSGDELIDSRSRFGEKILVSEGGEGQWGKPAPVQVLGEGTENNGTLCVTPEGKSAFFSSSYRKEGVGGTDLYRTYMAGAQWAKPECLTALNSKWWDAHPAVSDDGTLLVFATDRDAASRAGAPPEGSTGRGETDLWMARMTTNGIWGPPVKLPPPVNSPNSEISPCFGPDGYLYFATDRYGNGYDIVRSRETNGAWSEPELLGEPVNGPSNDCFPFVSADRRRMYFASDRPGGEGGLDLYTAEFPYRILLEGVVTLVDEQKNVTLPGAEVIYTVTNESTGEIRTAAADAAGAFRVPLLAGNSYRVAIGRADCFSTREPERIQTGVPFGLDTVISRSYVLRRAAFPTFELGRYNIPFFTTGYYYPNTPVNLDRMHDRLGKKELDIAAGGRTPYIDPDDEDYRAYADSIQSIFDRVYRKIEQDIIPLFMRCAYPTEALKLEVQGFVDPRGLTPGFYVDEAVQTDSMRIEPGAAMSGQEGNRKLANLRAWYTLKMIDGEMERRSPEYRELKKAGRILFSAYGKGIDTAINPSLTRDPAKRRIDITLSIERPGGSSPR